MSPFGDLQPVQIMFQVVNSDLRPKIGELEEGT